MCYSASLQRLGKFGFLLLQVLTMNIMEQIKEEMPNFTISFEDDLAMFWPAKATNHNESDSNELHCENSRS